MAWGRGGSWISVKRFLRDVVVLCQASKGDPGSQCHESPASYCWLLRAFASRSTPGTSARVSALALLPALGLVVQLRHRLLPHAQVRHSCGVAPPCPRSTFLRTCLRGGSERGGAGVPAQVTARTLEGAVALCCPQAVPRLPLPRARPRPWEGRRWPALPAHQPRRRLVSARAQRLRGAGSRAKVPGGDAATARSAPLLPTRVALGPGVEAASATRSALPTHPACSALPSAPRHL